MALRISRSIKRSLSALLVCAGAMFLSSNAMAALLRRVPRYRRRRRLRRPVRHSLAILAAVAFTSADTTSFSGSLRTGAL